MAKDATEDLAAILELDEKGQKIIKGLPSLKRKKKKKNKASGGVVRLKSGGPVVDSYDYS